MTPFQPVRGTRDLLESDKLRYRMLIDRARQVAEKFGYYEIETPLFEQTQVFYRLGESSDVVSKETYTFLDRGENSLTLRPEGTAPVVRALISNGLTQNLPGKYFYAGPMFRYDRPQKGRYRQFFQAGIELFGVETYHGDVEVLQLAENFLQAAGIRSNLVLEINTLGDTQSRETYREALVSYFSKYEKDLSPDSQRRLSENPLRILDSKDEKDQRLVQEAPFYEGSLTLESRQFFERVLTALEKIGIAYHKNPRLVRGLDYYRHTTFEYVTQDLGTQTAVLAGGRYDGLVAAMGGPDLPGVGWATGIDRVALLNKEDFVLPRPLVILPLGESAEIASFSLAQTCRSTGIPTEVLFTGPLPKRLKKAVKLRAHTALVLGDSELTSQKAQLRLLEEGQDETVSFSQLPTYLAHRFQKLR